MDGLSTSKDWSDEDTSILRAMWLDDKNDTEIGERLNRSSKSVQKKRRNSGLVSKLHPERPNKRGRRGGGARSYSREDDIDILARIDHNESVTSIAAIYGVTANAMGNKVDRLLLQREEMPEEPTERKCLMCLRTFTSIHPKSTHRRCPSCQSAFNDVGECLLTIHTA